jgi:hypothetical protein
MLKARATYFRLYLLSIMLTWFHHNSSLWALDEWVVNYLLTNLRGNFLPRKVREDIAACTLAGEPIPGSVEMIQWREEAALQQRKKEALQKQEATLLLAKDGSGNEASKEPCSPCHGSGDKMEVHHCFVFFLKVQVSFGERHGIA